MVLFGKIVEPSRDGALLQEVGHWGVLEVLQPNPTSCSFCASWLQVMRYLPVSGSCGRAFPAMTDCVP